MQNLVRQQRFAELRERIAVIEKRPLLAGASDSRRPGAAGESVLHAPAGLLHEVYADEQRNSGAALGFALGLAETLLTAERPAILFVQLVHDVRDVGLPYGPGLHRFGIDPERLVIARLAGLGELFWAIEEAIACRAVAAVVAEVLGAPKMLDFTVSRRLSLRAASGGASVLLLRYGREREASAARLRWCISPAMSQAPPFDEQAPGAPRWHVRLEKGRLGAGLMEAGLELWLDWTEHGFAPVAAGKEVRAGAESAAPAVSGPLSAALGDRLPQAV